MSKRDFIVIKKIGSGSFSNVYKVRRIEDDIVYAMKEIQINSLSRADREGALNEVRLLASIQSEYLVKYYDTFYDERSRSLCVIMEFAEFGDLQAKISKYKLKKTLIPEEDIWDAIKTVTKGLRDLHNQKIIHRDIKSANLFVYANKIVKIGDLNVSKFQKQGLARTQTGTPYYCPPEIWADKPYDSKCDIWSLGVVIYELCTGNPPFTSSSMQGLYKVVKTGKYSPVSSKYSKELSEFISKCLQVNPNKRPTANELISHYLVDFTKTLVKSNSNPTLLNTIKVPRDMLRLKALLPNKRYKPVVKDVIGSLEKDKNVSNISRPATNNNRRPVSKQSNNNGNINSVHNEKVNSERDKELYWQKEHKERAQREKERLQREQKEKELRERDRLERIKRENDLKERNARLKVLKDKHVNLKSNPSNDNITKIINSNYEQNKKYNYNKNSDRNEPTSINRSNEGNVYQRLYNHRKNSGEGSRPSSPGSSREERVSQYRAYVEQRNKNLYRHNSKDYVVDPSILKGVNNNHVHQRRVNRSPSDLLIKNHKVNISIDKKLEEIKKRLRSPNREMYRI